MVVYYYGVGVVPKVKNKLRNNGFPEIAIHVDTICAF